MQTLVFGLRHKSAPIEVREHLVFSPESIPKALRGIVSLDAIEQAIILSTCNRVEIYMAVNDSDKALAQVQRYLSSSKNLPQEAFLPYSFCLEGRAAAQHLFEVASGLDSLVLGEDQILSQVKEALHLAMLNRSVGLEIEKLFKTALTVGKAVRTESGIAARDISIAKAAFEFAESKQKGLLSQSILVIGGGKMAEILLGCLSQSIPLSAGKSAQVIVVNRHYERAQELAKQFGFKASHWDNLSEILNTVDNIFVATASPHFILKPEDFYSVKRPKFIVDISVPRNVDPTVGQFNGIHLFNTDHLQGFSGYTGENQQKLIRQAQAIIEREHDNLIAWEHSRKVAPLIAQIRAHFDDIRQDQVAQVLSKNPDLQDAQAVIESVSKTLLNRLLHEPTVALKHKAQNRLLNDPVAEFEQLFAKSLSGVDLVYDEHLEQLQQDNHPLLSKNRINAYDANPTGVAPLRVG